MLQEVYDINSNSSQKLFFVVEETYMQSNEDSKYQESVQSSTTSDPSHHMSS